MRYHNIAKDDMLNGDGIRAVLFVSGCTHHCPECQNPITWNKDGGLYFDADAKAELFKELEKSYVSGITFSGGDPLAVYNREEVLSLIEEIKDKFPDKTVWVYSGWTKTELEEQGFWNKLADKIDVFVEGKFEIAHKSTPYNWAGSTNQRVLRKESGFTLNTSDPVYIAMEKIKDTVKYAPREIKEHISLLADSIAFDAQQHTFTDGDILRRISSLSSIGIDDFHSIFDSEIFDDFQDAIKNSVKNVTESTELKYADAELENLLSDFAIFESNNWGNESLPEMLLSIKNDASFHFKISDERFDNWCTALHIKTQLPVIEITHSKEGNEEIFER